MAQKIFIVMIFFYIYKTTSNEEGPASPLCLIRFKCVDVHNLNAPHNSFHTSTQFKWQKF